MKALNKKKIIIIIIAAVFLISLMSALAIYMLKNNYSFFDLKVKVFGQENFDQGVYAVIELPERNALVDFSDNQVYIYSDKLLSIYDKSGNHTNSIIILHDNADMTGFSSGVMVYDKKIGNATLVSEGVKSGELSFNQEIFSAKGFNDYIVLIGGPKDGYMGSAIVLDKNGTIISRNWYSDRYPVSASITDNEKGFVITGIDYANVEKTFIDIYKMYTSTPTAGIDMFKNCPMVLSFGKEGFASIGSGSIHIYNSKGTIVKTHELEKIRYAVEDMESRIFINHRRSNDDYLMILSSDGSISWDFKSQFYIEGLDAKDNTFIAWGRNQILVYDQKSRSYESISGIFNIKRVKVLDGNILAIYSGDELLLYNLK